MKKTFKIFGIIILLLFGIYYALSVVFPNFIGIPLAGFESYKEFKKNDSIFLDDSIKTYE